MHKECLQIKTKLLDSTQQPGMNCTSSTKTQVGGMGCGEKYREKETTETFPCKTGVNWATALWWRKSDPELVLHVYYIRPSNQKVNYRSTVNCSRLVSNEEISLCTKYLHN